MGIDNTEHKGFITVALIIHATRSHEITRTALEAMESSGMGRFDFFWMLKNAWGNPMALARPAQALAGARWVLYRTRQHMFPLCDSPVIIERNRVTAILSPRLLLQVHLSSPSREDTWVTIDGISPGRVSQFTRLAMSNTYREIIFSSQSELARWRESWEFRRRRELLASEDGARDARLDGAARVAFALDGFDRVGPGFEEWAARHFGER